MSKWDYQTYYPSKEASIKSNRHIITIPFKKNEKLDNIISKFDGTIGITKKEDTDFYGNIKSSYLVTFIFDEKYIESCPKKYFASVHYFPPCDCCVLDDEIEVKSLDNVLLPCRTELKEAFTRYYVTIPDFTCYFSSSSETIKPYSTYID
jgi:hypothetical protein